ncbi:MAG: hypothetical protein AAGL49_12005 [Pseudomonadota bacterium]
METNPATPMTSATAERQTAARESFWSQQLTRNQLDEAWAISGIIRGEIEKTSSFRDKLTDYAHAYARAEKFDALRGEAILRDIYAARYGQSMNQTREGLMAAEENLTRESRAQQAHDVALRHANSIGPMIRDGATQPFYLAYDKAAVALAGELKITQSGAKALMKDVYRTAHDRGLYEAGKEVEEAYHRPVREAELAARKADKLQSRSQSRSMS